MGMMTANGYEVSLKNGQTCASWDAMIKAFLAHSSETPVHLGAVLEAEPEFGMGHAVKGLMCLMLGRKELIETARDCAGKAHLAREAGDMNATEALYLSALDVWLAGKPSVAIEEIEKVLRKHPYDALAAKISHGIRFMLGDNHGMRSSIEAIISAYGEDHPYSGYISGCYSFALEETGDYARAERFGHKGVEMAPDDAWGLHSVAHVYDMTGRADTGVQWLGNRASSWEHCNNFGYHVWWHLALFHLDRGKYDTVLDLYDRKVRLDHTDDYRDISNGASMLMRLELEGVDVGNRWEELANLSEGRTDDNCVVFADLHYMLSLLGGDRDEAARRLISQMEQQAANLNGDMDYIAKAPGLAAAQGLMAFSEGNHSLAFKQLASARNLMQTVGGSHAQRDVFERVTIEAGIRAGALHEVGEILTDRTRLRGAEDSYARKRTAFVRELSQQNLMAGE